MIMIAAALYCEAQPFIEYYNLKRDGNIHKFEVFKNENILLVITGTGSISAAVAVTYLSTLYPPAPSDLFINIGVCASSKKDIPDGTLYLCNKITEQVTGRCYYPDVLKLHPFKENSIVTCPSPFHSSGTQPENKQSGELIDMEAAGIYQAAAYFYQPHQLTFLKIISDHGDFETVSPERITKLVKDSLPAIAGWVGELRQGDVTDPPFYSPEEEQLINKLMGQLQCSVTMEYQLGQLLRYDKLSGKDIMKLIGSFMKKHDNLRSRTKTEGKMWFEQLKKELV